jgi:class 3 adenylate cyclase
MAAETITVMFTDLVGSTELASRLGPAVADELRRAHFSLLRGALADTDGTEVKNLGDGLMAVFNGPSHALTCAVFMQQAIHRHNRQAPELLSIRIGISAGEVVAEDGDYFGEPVVEAARLCAEADGGQILLGDVVRIMTRGRGHDLAPVGELQLKGLPEPVKVCELRWTPEVQERDVANIPLPTRVAAPIAVGFVGRTGEREVLRAALKAVTSNEGRRLVLISGEGGMGKSSLSFEAARDAFADGATVLYGRCDEDLGILYQPFVEALHHYAVHAPDDWLMRHEPTQLATITRLVPTFAKRLPDLPTSGSLEGEAEVFIFFNSVAAVLSDVSQEAPVVLILDDLHWADKPTLQLMRVLAGADLGRVLILGTFREKELSATHPLGEALAALRREPGVERVALSGLDDVEVLAYLEAAAGHAMDESGVELGHALLHETDGNPFFVREVLLHLVESGALVQQEGRWVGAAPLEEVGLPESVREVVGTRVARLGIESGAILAAAAVIGQEFDLDLLCAMTDRTEVDVLEALDAAEQSSLVAESSTLPGAFRFAHALIQHTIYEDLGPTRQARLHQRAANELELLCGADPLADAGDRVGELARHFLAATRPAEIQKAHIYATQAGDRAMASLAFDEAVRWYTRALETLELSSQRTENSRSVEVARSLIKLGNAQRFAGTREFVDTLLRACDIAEELGDSDLLVEAALTNNRGMTFRIGVVNQGLTRSLEQALAVVGDEDSVERARLLAALASELAFDVDVERRVRIAEEAIAVARRTGDSRALAETLVLTFLALGTPEHAESRLQRLQEARILIDALDMRDPNLFSVVDFWIAPTLVELGDVDGVPECIERQRAATRRFGMLQWRWGLAMLECWQALLSGNAQEGERQAALGLDLAQGSGQPEAFTFYVGQTFITRYIQGRLKELVPLSEQLLAMDDTMDSVLAIWAMCHAAEGDPGPVRVALDEQVSRGFDVTYDVNWLNTLLPWAEAAAELEHVEAAAVLFELLRPWADRMQVGPVLVLPSVAHALGRLAVALRRHDEAESFFAQSLALHERLRAPFLIAITKVAWAAARLARDPGHEGSALTGDTLDLLQGALELARQYGFGGVERDALALLGQ